MAYTIMGHGNCPRIPRISTFDEAKAHYESVIPIRGRGVECKPLGKERRYHWYTIRKNTYANQTENKEYHTYSAHLYNTDVVEFYPNGDVTLRTGGWATFTTGACINFVVGNLGSVLSESGKWYFQNKRGETFRWNDNELRLKFDESGVLVTKDIPVQEYKRTVNRKAMNAIRKKYKSIYEYGRNMLAIDKHISRIELQNNAIGINSTNLTDTRSWYASKSKDNRVALFKAMDKYLESGDLDLLYNLATYVACSAGRYSYRQDKMECYPEWFINKLDEVIKLHYRDEVFNAEPVPVGVVFNDRNKKYFY